MGNHHLAGWLWKRLLQKRLWSRTMTVTIRTWNITGSLGLTHTVAYVAYPIWPLKCQVHFKSVLRLACKNVSFWSVLVRKHLYHVHTEIWWSENGFGRSSFYPFPAKHRTCKETSTSQRHWQQILQKLQFFPFFGGGNGRNFSWGACSRVLQCQAESQQQLLGTNHRNLNEFKGPTHLDLPRFPQEIAGLIKG